MTLSLSPLHVITRWRGSPGLHRAPAWALGTAALGSPVNPIAIL